MRSRLVITTVLLAAFLIESAILVSAGFGDKTLDPKQPGQPIMGILTQPNPHAFFKDTCPQYVQQTYVEWLAQAGIRAVAVRYDLPQDEMSALLGSLNGVLFTGGDQDIIAKSGPAHTFYQAAEFIVNYTLKANKAKDKFVLWGTCQGFQLVTVASAMDFSILKCDFKGTSTAMLPLTFETTPNANNSRFMSPMFASATKDSYPSALYDDMAYRNSTANAHNCGIHPDAYTKTNEKLKSMYTLISTNVDAVGNPFASTIEHKEYDIYGTQWHPEGAQFWYDLGFNQEPSTMRVSQYAANFLVSKLRNNSRSFPTPEDAFKQLISQYEIGYKPADQYAGFYCLDVPDMCGTPYKSKAEGWEAVGVIAIVLLLLSIAGNVLMCIFNSHAVKPDPKPNNSKRGKRDETAPLNA